MKYWAVVWVFVALLNGCGGGGGSGGSSPSSPSGPNVLTVTIGQSAVCLFVNELCARVTICQAGTTSCQTISDVLVDIGSTGLRIFGSVLTIPLSQQVDSQGNPIGECAFFADGTAFWGPVQQADVILGSEPAVNLPLQVIAPTFAGQSSVQNPCNAPVDSSPGNSLLNGILGVGLFAEDCGAVCATQNNNNLYFSCAIVTSTCTGTTVSLVEQVQNPVMLLPLDNNGLSIKLPNVPLTGAPSASGSLILGIGTTGNNMPPAGVSVLTTDQSGFVTTFYKGAAFGQSVIDSGSNGLYFADASLQAQDCGGQLSGFYCPPNPVNLSATLVGANNHQANISFQVANTLALAQTGNAVFNNLGGQFPFFVWGIPFFLGQTTYVGFEGKTSSLGTGPLLAF